MNHEQYLVKAFNEAFIGMRSNKGGPFGAIVVLKRIIIGSGCNEVTSTNDPTAHAEIIAIRNACKKVNNFHLEDAVIYTTCEPCPMCLSAIYWTKIKKVYYCSSKSDAENIGFDDKYIYNELGLQLKTVSLELTQIQLSLGDVLFNEWLNKKDKTNY